MGGTGEVLFSFNGKTSNHRILFSPSAIAQAQSKDVFLAVSGRATENAGTAGVGFKHRREYADKSGHGTIKTAPSASGNRSPARLQSDAAVGAALVIEKVELLGTHRLQLPERHLAHLGGNLVHRPVPCLLVVAQFRQRVLVGLALGLQQFDDFRRLPGVLLQQTSVRAARRQVGRSLPSVVFGELFTDSAGRDFQRGIVVVAKLDAQVGLMRRKTARPKQVSARRPGTIHFMSAKVTRGV